MKNAPLALVTALKQAAAIKAVPEAYVDWNLNRYHDTRADNTPVEENAGFDVELFPIESIVEPLRPSKGINKARVGQSTVSREYYDVGGGLDARFYIADEDDLYKYWTSPKPAVGGVIPLFNLAEFPNDEILELTGHDGLTSARPKVEYGTWNSTHKVFTPGTVDTNKIVIKLENTWATPNDFDIVIARPGGNVTITNEELTAGWEGPGEIILRWNGAAWDDTSSLTTVNTLPVTDTISSVQLIVRTMRGGYQKTEPGEALVPTKFYRPALGTYANTDGDDAFLDVIEIGAHLEADLTPWLIDTDDTIDMMDSSPLYPMGTVTSNSANITLSNIYQDGAGEWVLGLFSRDNTDPTIPWTKYLEPNAEMTLWYNFSDADTEASLGRLRQFTMYTDLWGGQTDEAVVLELMDYSKFLNEQTTMPAMWEDLKVPEIIWRVLDSVGFNNYKVDRDIDRVTEHRIPVFYMNGEETAWAVLDQLAQASQTAIFFDNENRLQVKTRDFAFSAADAPVWKFQSYDDVEQLANIASLTQTTQFEPNSIKVIYQKTNWSKYQNGQPVLQTVWEPEDETVVLRGSPLVKDLGKEDTFMWLNTKDAKLWPWEGMVNIQGEIIKYKGKQYKYYHGDFGDQSTTTIVDSIDEQHDIDRDKTTDGYQYKNHYTGALRIAEDKYDNKERGYWNTEVKNHNVDMSNWSVRQIVNGTSKTDVKGFSHIKEDSQVEIKPGSRHKDYADLLVATLGGVNDSPFWFYGTQMSFVKKGANGSQVAGMLIFNNGANEDGYYIEFTTKALTAAQQNKRKSLTVFSQVNGKRHLLGKTSLAIAEDFWYEVDVTVAVQQDGDHRLGVWFNGKNVFDEVVKPAKQNTPNGKFGFFARGSTTARFEFLYALKKRQKELKNDFSFLDKVRRSYYGQQWDREWIYEWREKTIRRRRKRSKVRYRYNDIFFDEFGPIVHEIREYDVSFDPVPVLHSRMYATNDWSAVVLDYRGHPFGAKFIVANTARHNTVLHGEDTLSFPGTDNAVNQLLNIFGRPLIIEDASEILEENTDQIRARGKIESELSDMWIQTEAMAKDVAKWIRTNFTYGNDQLTLSVFGNPLLEPSDVVHVDYPEKGITADYFVTSIRTTYEAGIMTELSLRRRV